MKKLIFNRRFIIILCVIILGIVAYNVFILFNWVSDKGEIARDLEEVKDELEIKEVQGGEKVNPPAVGSKNDYWHYIKMPLLDVNIPELKKINSDTVGFIKVNGTNISYPVVQSKNNSFYIEHSFKKEKNRAGWVFMDYRNNSANLGNNTIIYGHSRIDGTMFGTLKNILKTSWKNNKDNYIINLSLPNKNTLWQVFSVYTLPVENYYIKTEFANNKRYNDWLQTMLKRSEFKFNTSVNTKDKVLTLSTCYDTVNNKRVVLQAKLIKRALK